MEKKKEFSMGDLMEWKKARKKPIVIEFREVRPLYHGSKGPYEKIETREGVLYGWVDKDFIIKGIRGEIYPIGKDIFYETYEVLE